MLTLFIHDDVSQEQFESLRRDYLGWALAEIESISGRTTQINFIRNRPPYTNFIYKHIHHANTLKHWSDLVFDYRASYNRTRSPRHKFMLITNNRLNDATLGLTELKGEAGIASLETYTAAAHELGHMLNGTHENAEILFDGWFCETNIYPTRVHARSNCKRYSDKNREVIAAYMRNMD